MTAVVPDMNSSLLHEMIHFVEYLSPVFPCS